MKINETIEVRMERKAKIAAWYKFFSVDIKELLDKVECSSWDWKCKCFRLKIAATFCSLLDSIKITVKGLKH